MQTFNLRMERRRKTGRQSVISEKKIAASDAAITSNIHKNENMNSANLHTDGILETSIESQQLNHQAVQIDEQEVESSDAFTSAKTTEQSGAAQLERSVSQTHTTDTIQRSKSTNISAPVNKISHNHQPIDEMQQVDDGQKTQYRNRDYEYGRDRNRDRSSGHSRRHSEDTRKTSSKHGDRGERKLKPRTKSRERYGDDSDDGSDVDFRHDSQGKVRHSRSMGNNHRENHHNHRHRRHRHRHRHHHR